ncbi:RNA polymerase sigma factor [Flavisphingomonas formosensis]|uniref:RNA polymerase sigma factor n=1 Tax=Flavisphingomonas formosensis TaxID=861534 RepID=UPI0012FB583C|nr:RNA polymerase sigma factor [Sphingomonas formosensis]
MEAFEQGLIALLPRLRRFAHGLAGSGADADDLVQQAIERALRARDQWQPGTRLDSWLYRIVRNAWIDTARARGRQAKVMLPEEAGAQAGYDPRPAVEARMDLAAVTKAMDQLPDEQREVLLLVLIEGFGYREAAEILEIPAGTLASRLARGRTALLALLGEG